MANARLGWFSPLGVAASIRASAGRVGLRAHCFRFSARTASEIPLGGWRFRLPFRSGRWASSFFRLPLRGCHWASSFFRLPFRRLPFVGLAFGLTASVFGMRRFGVAAGRVGSSAFRFGVALGGLVFGLIASAFRHAPIRGGRWASSFFRLPLRKLPSAGWPSGSPLPLFGTHRFGDCPRRVGLRAHRFRFSACTDSGWPLGEFVLSPSASEIALGGLAFGLTASAFRHAPLRRLPSASSFFRLPLRRLPSASWPSGSPLPLFGMRRSAPPRR